MSGSSQRPPTPPFNPALLASLLQGANVPEVFANQMRTAVTLTDFSLAFGVAESPGPALSAVTRDRVVVHLAPAMVKQLFLHLKMAVEAYEEAVAIIPIPSRIEVYLDAVKTDLVSKLKDKLSGPTDAEIAAALPHS